MLIDEARFQVEFEWEGELAPPSGVYVTRGDGLPRVSLGRPAWWSDQKVLGEQWTSPAGGHRHGLARFAFSLRPGERQSVRSAEFIVYLHARGAGPRPIFFDLLPKVVTEEQTGSRAFGIDPKFKFAGAVEFSGVKAETTINVKQAVPVIAADGIGESTARWVFEARPAHPLVGSQMVYAVVELPPGVESARASLQRGTSLATPSCLRGRRRQDAKQ